MKYFEFALAVAAAVGPAAAQTYTKCNPLKTSCPANPALSKSINYDFTKGQSADFTVEGGTPTYDSTNGLGLPIAKSGDYPTLVSKWFIMFGHIDITMKTAPGAGIVNSLTMQSDDLDEIDWEWLGSQNGNQVQTNYFGKGITGNYDRGTNVEWPTVQAQTKATKNFQEDWHTYSIDWTADRITWSVDGVNVRTLTAASAQTNQYPQTPMQLKVGIWAGGDPSNNAPGVVTWSGGPTDFSKGPFTMQVKSVKAIDYSTGTTYSYGDSSGNWQSIKSAGGSIKNTGDPNQAGSNAPTGGSSSSAPTTTATSAGSGSSSPATKSSTGKGSSTTAAGSGATTSTSDAGSAASTTLATSAGSTTPSGTTAGTAAATTSPPPNAGAQLGASSMIVVAFAAVVSMLML